MPEGIELNLRLLGNVVCCSIFLEVDKTRRPRDLGVNDDRHWLGLVVNWLEIEPPDSGQLIGEVESRWARRNSMSRTMSGSG